MSRTVRVTGALLLAIALMAIVGPWLSPHDYVTTNFNSTLSPPSLVDQHFFGTDDLGRDLFVRTMMGIRITLSLIHI